MVPVVGCEDTTPTPEERQAVEATITGYLGALAEAYSTFDLQPLRDWASPNEIAAVNKLLRSLAQTRDRVESSLLVFEVEHLEIFREINATVRLVEVWDVVRFDATTGVEKGRTPESIQYTLLQLRLVDEKWIVVGRSVLNRETPVPEPEEESSV
jgi:hypothetical protein